MADDSKPALGTAKVVKLGNDTVLIVEVKNGADIAEGEFTIKAINASPAGPAGAGDCIIQFN